MKKTITIIVFLLLLGSQAIANGLSELNLKTLSNSSLKVVIDGQLVSNNSSYVEIKNIPFGTHSLQVFKILSSFNSYNEEPLFIGEIYLPQNTITSALIKHHKFIIIEQMALVPVQQNIVYNYQNNYCGPKPIFWVNNNQAPVCGIQEVVYEEPIVELFPMSNENFNVLKKAIKNEWFSDGKLLVFKQAINAGNLFTAQQVNELIDLYSFSGEQLEVAKIAYHSTLDPENYFLVFEQLHWSSSKRELNDYIASM